MQSVLWALLLLLLLTTVSVLAAPSPKTTVARRETVHEVDNGSAICVSPAPWSQILAFFVTNYITRAFTFKKVNGYSGYRDYVKTLLSFFIPFLGISQAAATISRGSRFLGEDELGRALHAEALCVIVRGVGWRPEDGEIVRGCSVKNVGPSLASSELRRRPRSSSRRHSHRRSGSTRRSKSSRRSHRRHRSSSNYAHDYGYDDDGDYYYDDDPVRLPVTLVVPPSRLHVIVEPQKWKIQGFYSLPESYMLASLRPGVEIQALSTSAKTVTRKDITLSSSYGVVKSFAAVVQIVSSLYSVYSVYATQVEIYGYAAFGFSVLPYTIMSTLNAVSNMVEADYNTLYLVRSDVMVEAERRERGEFIGEVAELSAAPTDIEKYRSGKDLMDLCFHRDRRGHWVAWEVDVEGHRVSRNEYEMTIPHLEELAHNPHMLDGLPQLLVPPVGQEYDFDYAKYARSEKFRQWAVWSIITLSLSLPYIVIGALSHFQEEKSTRQQRIFMMGWLVAGQVIGLLDIAGNRTAKKRWLDALDLFAESLLAVVGIAFSIGGFVQVGRMVREFGYCIHVGG